MTDTAQDNPILITDKIADLIETLRPATIADRARLWMEKGSLHLESPGDEIDAICMRMQELEEPSGYQAGLAWGRLLKGWQKLKHGETEQARSIFLQALGQFEDSQDLKGQARTLNALGVVDLYCSLYDNALALLLQAHKLASALDWQELMGVLDTNMGLVYLKLGQAKEAVQCLEAAKINPQLETINKVNVNIHLAEALLALSSYDEAEELLITTLKSCQDENYPISWIDANGSYARLLHKKGEHAHACELYVSTLEAAHKLDNWRMLVAYGIEYAAALQANGQLEEACSKAEDMTSLAEIHSLPSEQGKGYQLLAGIYASQSRWQQAWETEHKAGKVLAHTFNEKVAGQAASAKAERAASETAAYKKQLRHLSMIADIGREIASAIDIASINQILYNNIKSLMPADGFGVAVYSAKTRSLNFINYMEKGQPIPDFSLPVESESSLAAFCLRTRQDIRIGNIHTEYRNYIKEIKSMGEQTLINSLMYCPITFKGSAIAIMTAQSERVDAYEEYHLEILRALSVYVSVALENSRLFEELKSIAGTDPLTGTLNRRKFMEVFINETERMRRYATDMTFVIFDIDNFKAINDSHGHAFGDLVLKEVANLSSRALRASDIMARYGGEEFAMILPNTNLDGGQIVAERIRKAFMSNPLPTPEGTPVNFTASFGLTLFVEHDDFDSLVSRADKALYYAKNTGRNKVAIERPLVQTIRKAQ
jgi:diguanylate cyclase (GGDEF)-like protein